MDNKKQMGRPSLPIAIAIPNKKSPIDGIRYRSLKIGVIINDIIRPEIKVRMGIEMNFNPTHAFVSFLWIASYTSTIAEKIIKLPKRSELYGVDVSNIHVK